MLAARTSPGPSPSVTPEPASGFGHPSRGRRRPGRAPLTPEAARCTTAVVIDGHAEPPPAPTGPARAWTEAMGRHWAADAERYDRMLAPLGARSLDAAGLRTGSRVLDVGCGAGATTLDAAARVGPRGHVVGVDVCADLLALAHRRVQRRALGPVVTLLEADVQRHRLAPASLDAIVSRLGMTYFDDAPAALANLARALRPGGTLAFSCWRDPSRNPWASAPRDAISTHLGLPPAPVAEAGPFAFADADRIGERLSAAGFDPIGIEPFAYSIHLAHDVEDAVDFYTRAGLGAFLQRLPSTLSNAVIDTLSVRLRSHRRAEGVFMDGAAWLVTAVAKSDRNSLDPKISRPVGSPLSTIVGSGRSA